MKENSIEKLQERLETLHVTQDARLASNADDLDIREEIAEVEEEIKKLEDDINEENSNGSDTNVGNIEDIKILEDLKIANERCIRNSKIKDSPFIAIWEKQNNAIEHILQDYKRVLKENDCLKNHVHYKNCIACGKEFRSKRNDARYCIKCSKQIANKNYIANLTEEQKLRRREQAKLAMRKLRANK